MKKITALLISVFAVTVSILLGSLCVNAAAKKEADGLKVSIKTDQGSYRIGDDVQISITVKNNNFYAVTDIDIETLVPTQLVLEDRGELNTTISLEAGQSKTLKAIANVSMKNSTLLILCICIGVIIIAGVVGGIFIYKTKQRKKVAQVLSLFLCISMILSITSVSVLANESEPHSNRKTIIVQKEIEIGNKMHTIEVSVGYQTAIVTEGIAALFGVDNNQYDTDGDGLSDYMEIYHTGTDPMQTDTDANGIGDADEDLDLDGISNIDEQEARTNPGKKDTDNDSLTDYQELFETNTHPCDYDTDDDTLSDGDELHLGLDPLKKRTDGKRLDSERIFTQQLDCQNFNQQLLLEDNGVIPALTLTTNGNINSRIFVDETDSNGFSDSRAIVGAPIDIIGDNIGEGILSFNLVEKSSTSLETPRTYNTKLICRYHEDGATEYLDTAFDEESNTVSAKISETGTYYLLDVENLFDELGMTMPDDAVVYTRTKISDSQNKVHVMAQADIVFIIDTTGSMDDEIYNTKENMTYFVDALREKGVSSALALIDYQDIQADGYDSTKVHRNGASNWFYDIDEYKAAIAALRLGDGGDEPESAVDALETARLLDMRPSAGKIFVLITDASYKVDNRYGIPSMEAEIELLKNAGVTCAVVSPSYEQSTYYDLYNATDGIWADIYGDFYTELMALAEKIGSDIVGDGYWIYLDGPVPVPVRLDEEPTAGSTVDTDKDGIYDIDELEGIAPTGSIDLDELLTKVSGGVITGTDYGTVMMYKYKSSPVAEDTDFDGLCDLDDEQAKTNVFSGTLKMSETSPTIKYTVDFRDFFVSSSKFNAELSQTSLIFSSVMYENGILDYDEATGLEDSILNEVIVSYHMDDVVDYHLDKGYVDEKVSFESYYDDDISEVIFGHKKIRYNGDVKEIVAVFIRGTNGTIEEWSSNFDLGNLDECEKYSDWSDPQNHKGFDVASTRIVNALDEYIDAYVGVCTKAFWVTGHSRGAAIANITSAELIDQGNEVFAYTFATPNTTIDEDAHSSQYNCIFNIVNENDFVTCVPMSAWGFSRYGRSTRDCRIEGDSEKEWEKFTGKWDYNPISQKTLNSLIEKLAKCSNNGWASCHTYTCECHSILSDEELIDNSIIEKGVEPYIYEEIIRYNRPDKYCRSTLYNRLGVQKQYKLCQTPAYFMQVLAEIMVEQYGLGLGGKEEQITEIVAIYSLADKYESARNQVVLASVMGIEHQHYTETYYIINRHISEKSFA